MKTLPEKPFERVHSSESGFKRLAGLSLAALGVVFGDIGTSPLYALRECFHGEFGIPVTHTNVLGVLSLLIWALILIVSLKYLTFIMKADNDGEGGILSLLGLIKNNHYNHFIQSYYIRMKLYKTCFYIASRLCLYV